jgi:hypothetical protein
MHKIFIDLSVGLRSLEIFALSFNMTLTQFFTGV